MVIAKIPGVTSPCTNRQPMNWMRLADVAASARRHRQNERRADDHPLAPGKIGDAAHDRRRNRDGQRRCRHGQAHRK